MGEGSTAVPPPSPPPSHSHPQRQAVPVHGADHRSDLRWEREHGHHHRGHPRRGGLAIVHRPPLPLPPSIFVAGGGGFLQDAVVGAKGVVAPEGDPLLPRSGEGGGGGSGGRRTHLDDRHLEVGDQPRRDVDDQPATCLRNYRGNDERPQIVVAGGGDDVLLVVGRRRRAPETAAQRRQLADDGGALRHDELSRGGGRRADVVLLVAVVVVVHHLLVVRRAVARGGLDLASAAAEAAEEAGHGRGSVAPPAAAAGHRHPTARGGEGTVGPDAPLAGAHPVAHEPYHRQHQEVARPVAVAVVAAVAAVGRPRLDGDPPPARRWDKRINHPTKQTNQTLYKD